MTTQEKLELNEAVLRLAMGGMKSVRILTRMDFVEGIEV